MGRIFTTACKLWVEAVRRDWRLACIEGKLLDTGMLRTAILGIILAGALWGQYPPEQQWRRIRTGHFDIFFPSEVTADAQRLANALETCTRL